MSCKARYRLLAVTACACAALGFAALAARPSRAQPSLGQLGAQLSGSRARAQSLSASVASLAAVVARLNAQVALVRSREAEVQAQLASDRSALAAITARLAAERARAALLQQRLVAARRALAASLLATYESDPPDIVRVVLEAHGFTDLVDQLQYVSRALAERRSIIDATRTARAAARSAAVALAGAQARERELTRQESLRSAALAGMNALLAGREQAAARAQAAERDALAAERARGARLAHSIAVVKAQQAAAAAAAAAQAAASASASPGPALGASGGWAIPYAIVLCESGGQNLPPNSAGASGYYQIIPSTWSQYGGTGPAAWLASKAEQDAVAARIYDGGRGVSNWDCAAIVGIH